MSSFSLLRHGLVLGVAFAIAACSASSESEDDGSSAANAVTASSRWQLPTTTRAVGSKVRITYEGPPKWSTKACTGGLKIGAKTLGAFLSDQFEQVSSVGGYACRQNTANASELSVHGTGRALDVFIPTTKAGGADNEAGDPVANWLVTNASVIGVQLIIWDRSIWRANGTNEGAYGGPVPHVDHIHVELTNSAAAMNTAWFANPTLGDMDGGASSSSTTDASTSTSDATNSTTKTDASSTTPPSDPDPPPADPDPPNTDPDPADPPPPSDPDPDPKQADPSTGTPAKNTPSTPTTPADPASSYETSDTSDDGPGERSSIPESRDPSGTVTSRTANDQSDMASSGCSVIRTTSQSSNAIAAIALSLAAALVLRKRRRA